jgi:hypothetical protein
LSDTRLREIRRLEAREQEEVRDVASLQRRIPDER